MLVNILEQQMMYTHPFTAVLCLDTKSLEGALKN